MNFKKQNKKKTSVISKWMRCAVTVGLIIRGVNFQETCPCIRHTG